MSKPDTTPRDIFGLPKVERPMPKQPAKSLLNGHRYTDAASTDLRKTFARIRREQRREQTDAQSPDAAVIYLPHHVAK